MYNVDFYFKNPNKNWISLKDRLKLHEHLTWMETGTRQRQQIEKDEKQWGLEQDFTKLAV